MGLFDKIVGLGVKKATTVLRTSGRGAYKSYKNIVKQEAKTLTQQNGIKVEIVPTAKKIVKRNGFTTETLETLQSMEFMSEFHKFLAKKGYKTPSQIAFAEHMIPKESGVVGQAINDFIVYNPRCLSGIDFRVPVHELGHTLTKKLTGWTCGFKQLPYHWIDRIIPCLNKNERAILLADYQRAFKEGYLKHNHWIRQSVRDGFKTNKEIKLWLKNNPAQEYADYANLNRFEFIAEYFNLAAKGFKWSPEITAKYHKYKGPAIKEIITEEELQQLEKLRKQIMKKRLSDYGISIKS